MEFELIGRDRLRVEISCEELSEYHLTYAQLDYSNQPTKKAITDILMKASAAAGFPLRGGKMLIEVFPVRGGGCSIIFTRLPSAPRRFTPVPGKSTASFTFDALEDVLSAARRIDRLSLRSSRLYQCGARFTLTVSAPRKRDLWVLGEFGNRLENTDAARMEEHGQYLTDGSGILNLLSCG